jgi:putative oxidoreductase
LAYYLKSPHVRFGSELLLPLRRNPDMLERFLETDLSKTLLAQRLLLGVVMLPHGAQKLLGWFGGYGFSGTMEYFTGAMHLPGALAFLVIVSEAFGSLGLILGLGTRLAAFGAAATMIGAVLTTHLQAGFFMNWFGNQPGEGFEYHLLALALALPLLARGGGAFALDRWLLGALTRRRMSAEEGALRAAVPPGDLANRAS